MLFCLRGVYCLLLCERGMLYENCCVCLAEFALNPATSVDSYLPDSYRTPMSRSPRGRAIMPSRTSKRGRGGPHPKAPPLESMQADGVLEYIVDHAVGVDVTASSLA